MIAHKLHLFLPHSSSFVLEWPRVHALSVPWKNKPEVAIPPPTSCFTVELMSVLGSVLKREQKEEYVTLTRTRDALPSHLGS